MKKIISLMLCIVFMSLALVSCADDEIGEDLKNRVTGNENDNELEVLNFYIIVGERTAVDAMKTVPQNINAYLKETYHIELNIVYCTESEYDAKVLSAASNPVEENRADIVLINSKGLFETLFAQGALVNITDYYNSKEYTSLNTIVEDKLLAASVIVEKAPGQESVTDESLIKYTSSYYTVPNNHLIGEYKYIVINKNMVRDVLNFSEEKIASMTTEASLGVIKTAISSYFGETSFNMDDYVRVVSGNYADKELLEYGVSGISEIDESSVKTNFVNISAYPTATPEEAFSSAYAIVKNAGDVDTLTDEQRAAVNKHYGKCMDIIFALNTDSQLKNMLQYGYVGTNYKHDKLAGENTIELLKGEQVVYNMNPIYTGNLYISYYCEEIGWTESAHSSTLKQNANAYTRSEKSHEEINELSLADISVSENTEITLPLAGKTHGDVSFVWTSDSEYVVVSGDKLIITMPEESLQVAIYLEIFVGGVEGSNPINGFNINLVKDA